MKQHFFYRVIEKDSLTNNSYNKIANMNIAHLSHPVCLKGLEKSQKKSPQKR